MNGIHDLGGMHGFGPINPEKDEPIFHEDWQKHMLALFPATFVLGFYNIDQFRHEIERMGAAEYLGSSYYEHWLHALESLALRQGIVTEEELRTGHAAAGSAKGQPGLAAADVPAVVAHGGSARVDADVKPKFSEGDMVVCKNINPSS